MDKAMRCRLLLLLRCSELSLRAAQGTGEQTLFDAQRGRSSRGVVRCGKRSGELRQLQGGTGGRKGEKICLRAGDVVDYTPLIGPSLVAVKGGSDTNTAARDFARGLNINAYYLL